MDWNRRLKTIARALRLTAVDIARATTLGGQPTTRSAAQAWMASPESTKIGVRGQTLRKYREMTEGDFDAFLAGLKLLLDEIAAEEE